MIPHCLQHMTTTSHPPMHHSQHSTLHELPRTHCPPATPPSPTPLLSETSRSHSLHSPTPPQCHSPH